MGRRFKSDQGHHFFTIGDFMSKKYLVELPPIFSYIIDGDGITKEQAIEQWLNEIKNNINVRTLAPCELGEACPPNVSSCSECYNLFV